MTPTPTPPADPSADAPIAERLTREHRQVESAFEQLEPGLKDVAQGHDSTLRADEVAALVARCAAHARYEESSTCRWRRPCWPATATTWPHSA